MLNFWITAGVTLLVGLAAAAIYRLYLHPLAKFPGPKLAAVTHLYEAYYDVLKKGRYVFEFERMHNKYGPIVRIGPNELHIRDSEYYNTLYNMTNRLDKYEWFYSMLGNPQASFGTIRSDVHRVRRGALSPFFSLKAVAKFYPHVQSIVNRLMQRMELCSERDEPIPLFYAYRCMTVDIISEYVFGHQMGMLDRADWGSDFYSAWRSLWELSPTIRQLPFLMDLIMSTPRWITQMTDPRALEVVDLFSYIDRQVKIVLDSDPEKIEAQAQPPVVWELSKSDVLPASEKTFKRLAVEANGMVAAGFETTGGTLTMITYLLLTHQHVFQKLLEELEEAIPDPDNIPNVLVLEKLPYLFAVVKESLRITVGAYSRLSRVNHHESMRYNDWIIPAGTAIGMSALFISHDPLIFPSPFTFNPHRWLEPDGSIGATALRLEHYLVPFGKGPRSCVGLNLAYAELYSVIATVLRRFGRRLELFETAERDMEVVSDYFAGMTRRPNGVEGNGLRVKVRKL
ncbi:cytochrome P450 [Lepidopterella palustris CBS 459.81]|uniref:Cytochrome P450 n=1 Tax=Lepidopterella palustris CBS 459.81 TaxID=1314670 RepID=A0A8E2J8U7_9PEZI|nr:cytochrome P450 [Lepidopterella palustris CBS 459.81]